MQTYSLTASLPSLGTQVSEISMGEILVFETRYFSVVLNLFLSITLDELLFNRHMDVASAGASSKNAEIFGVVSKREYEVGVTSFLNAHL
jgi:hypothetical protein